MKKICLIFILCSALSACAGENSSEKAKNAALENTNAARTAADIEQPVNAASQMPRGEVERIDAPREIDFRDGLPKGWDAVDPEKENPSGFDLQEGVLKMRIPAGKDLSGENLTAPRFLKTVAGDFEVETRLKFSPVENYQGAGIVIFRNDNNYLRLERGFGGDDDENESGIRLQRREDEIFEPINGAEDFSTRAVEVELKFRRTGGDFTAFWREAGKPLWIEVGRVSTNYPDALQIGLFGVSTAEAITAEFVYIRLLPATK